MNWNKDEIIPVLLQAGNIAFDYFKQTKNTIKGDGSIVTEADIAVERFLKDKLHGSDQFWIGEESSGNLEEDEFLQCLQGNGYIVDPIDGTMNYANGLEMWGISVGWVREGTFSEGAIYLPCFRELYITDGPLVKLLSIESGVVVSEKVLRPVEDWTTSDEERMICVTQSLVKKKILHYAGGVQSISSAVFVIAKVLTGGYFGYVSKLKIWDVAAALPMCSRLGIEVAFQSGEEISLKVSRKQYWLKSTSPNRFSLRRLLVFCKRGEAGDLLDKLGIDKDFPLP